MCMCVLPEIKHLSGIVECVIKRVMSKNRCLSVSIQTRKINESHSAVSVGGGPINMATLF